MDNSKPKLSDYEICFGGIMAQMGNELKSDDLGALMLALANMQISATNNTNNPPPPGVESLPQALVTHQLQSRAKRRGFIIEGDLQPESKKRKASFFDDINLADEADDEYSSDVNMGI